MRSTVVSWLVKKKEIIFDPSVKRQKLYTSEYSNKRKVLKKKVAPKPKPEHQKPQYVEPNTNPEYEEFFHELSKMKRK